MNNEFTQALMRKIVKFQKSKKYSLKTWKYSHSSRKCEVQTTTSLVNVETVVKTLPVERTQPV